MSATREHGIAALQRGEAAGAVPYLEQACRTDAADYRACFHLGIAYGTCRRFPEAAQALTRAVQLEPASAQARYQLGLALAHAGRPADAELALSQAQRLAPG